VKINWSQYSTRQGQGITSCPSKAKLDTMKTNPDQKWWKKEEIFRITGSEQPLVKKNFNFSLFKGAEKKHSPHINRSLKPLCHTFGLPFQKFKDLIFWLLLMIELGCSFINVEVFRSFPFEMRLWGLKKRKLSMVRLTNFDLTWNFKDVARKETLARIQDGRKKIHECLKHKSFSALPFFRQGEKIQVIDIPSFSTFLILVSR